MRVDQREGGIVADSADIAEMVGDPLEFCEQGTQPYCAIGYDKFEGRFSRPRKRIGIGNGAVARYASGELDSPLEVSSVHEPLDALVGISQPLFQPDHGLPARGKPEMPRFDDAGMHGPDRNLMQALAFDRKEAVGCRPRHRVDAIA